MPPTRTISEIRLVNGSTGDPSLFVDYPGRDDAILFDLLADWAPDEATRNRILVDNPAALYRFG